MAARTVGGLSSADLDRVRTSLAAGRKPKVVFTEASGQLAGQLGQVVELTDPTASEEWVVVRFGHDMLSFAPTDLAIPPKSARPARRGPSAAVTVPAAAPPAPPAPPAGSPQRQREEHEPTPTDSTPTEPAPDPTPETPAGKAPARKAAKAKAPVALAVTIGYTDGAWTLAAQQGNRVLAKPTQIRTSEALKLIGQLAVPELQAAADEIVAADRAAAERDADRLRAELAEIEARIADLDT